jgi:hypothetical protein
MLLNTERSMRALVAGEACFSFKALGAALATLPVEPTTTAGHFSPWRPLGMPNPYKGGAEEKPA